MAQSERSPSANCTGLHRRVWERGNKNDGMRKLQAEWARGSLSCPYVELQPYTVIKNRLGATANGQERDCVLKQQGTIKWFKRQQQQSWESSAEPLSWYRLTLLRIQFAPSTHQSASDLHTNNPICLSALIRMWGPGTHTVAPIQFAPSVLHVLTVA